MWVCRRFQVLSFNHIPFPVAMCANEYTITRILKRLIKLSYFG